MKDALFLERQKMIEVGIDFLMNNRGEAKGWRSYVNLSRKDAESISFEEVTKIIAYHIREGYFMWKDLPKSWSSCIPLARECVHVRQSPSLISKGDGSSTNKFKWEHLPDVCRSNVDVALTAISNSFIQEWEDIPISVQNNESVAFAAWVKILRWHEKYYSNLIQLCPTLDRDFFKTCIEQEKIDDWDDLPHEHRTDIEFARGISFFPSKSIAYSILDEFSELCQEREIWLKVLSSTSIHSYIGSLIELFAPNSITSDRALMIQACQFDTVLRSVNATLGQNRSFLIDVLQRHPQQLAYLDNESQLIFPDLVLNSLKPFADLNLSGHAIMRLIDNLDNSFWNDQSNYALWLKSGLPHPQVLLRNTTIADAYYDCEETAFLIAAHCREGYRRESFLLATSDRLRSDKSFMTKGLELDPQLIFCAADELQTDFDLALISIGNSKQVYDFYKDKQTTFVSEYFDTVSEQLSLYDSYVCLVLGGIMQPQSYLSRLGQGNETTISFKQSIAAFLGVPFGRRLRWLRQSASFRCEDEETIEK